MPKRKKSSDTNSRNRRARYNTEHISNDTAHEEQTDLSHRTALKFIGCASLEYYENGHKSLPSNNDIGSMSFCCQSCGAYMWKNEVHTGSLNTTAKFSTCCQGGKILLPAIQDPPDILKSLLADDTLEAKHFRHNIRAFNSSLAFASLGVQQENLPSSGPYTFRVCGSVYHRIGHLLPDAGKAPKFSQIYIYDTDNEIQKRSSWNSGLDQKILSDLQAMMHICNPYVEVFKNANSVLKRSVDESSFKLVLKADTSKDLRRYNLPSASELAVIIVGSSTVNPQKRDSVLYKQSSCHPAGYEIQHISEIHPQYDPLHYVLIFPYGQLGWTLNISQLQNTSKHVSAMSYYSFHLMHRQNFNLLLRCGRLLHQFIVDQYAKIEQERLNYCFHHQKELRSELYQGLNDSYLLGDTEGSRTGRRIVLPSSFIGGPRNMYQLFQDAMAIVRRYGKPDLFVTFTCNPKWPEILNALLPGQVPSDRPDLIARVFHQKLKELLKDITQKCIFGKVIAYVYTIEFQKRGLPHAHILIILEQSCTPTTPEEYDLYVSAEIPNRLLLPELYNVVTQNMIHGPCGEANRQSPCMDDGKCTKGFPKEYVSHTSQSSDGYPKYRRRDNGVQVEKQGVLLDNRWIVPYNPYLITKFSAHINVEICSSVVAVKYLYKYVYKGHDRIMASIQQEETNEIQRYLDARYVSACEASWRIFHYELHNRSPAIQRLAIHLPGQQTVIFREGHVEEALENPQHTTLTAWFLINRNMPEAKSIPYHLFPEYFTWNSGKTEWKKRKSGKSIGRIYRVNPAEGERFYLRLLLHHTPGCTSFEDIRTLPDGSVCNTFKEAALKCGFLQDDNEWHECLSEAVESASPSQLRILFVTILVYCEPAKPELLWENFKHKMAEDLLYKYDQILSEDCCIEQALLQTDKLLVQNSRSLGDYPDMPIPQQLAIVTGINNMLIEEMSYSFEAEKAKANHNETLLNLDQHKIYTAVVGSVLDEKRCNNEKNVYFIDGPGGTGKTFLYNTVLARVRSEKKIAIAVASSGIAAELLDGGRTAHSRFKIPIPILPTSTCNISRQSQLAALIEKTGLIIWDEAPMLHKYVFECVHRTICDIMHNDKPFGGKTVVLGGDFRQVLPVIRHGSQADIIECNLKRSFLWEHTEIFRLKINMRVHGSNSSSGDGAFEKYLLSVGNGTETLHPAVGFNKIKLPADICVHPDENGIDNLIRHVYPSLTDGDFTDDMYKRAILSPRNENVDLINTKVMELIPSTRSKTYISADSVADSSQEQLYPTEFLNSLTPSGIPPHTLHLKEMAPVLLLRNLNPKQGLLNGTRLCLKSLGNRVIEATIMTGKHIGSTVFLPRITLTPSDPGLPFDLQRRQFPIRPAFAMSINKAQGQTLECVGINLSEPVFTHGQLYVAMSRVRSFNALSILPQAIVDGQYYTDNVVYRDVL